MQNTTEKQKTNATWTHLALHQQNKGETFGDLK
jgi:hypothetical protein